MVRPGHGHACCQPGSCLALTQAHAWLQPRPALAAVLGALAGPVTYVGAARLGAAELLLPLPQVGALVALEYALALPLLLLLSRGVTPPPPPDPLPAETDRP